MTHKIMNKKITIIQINEKTNNRETSYPTKNLTGQNNQQINN
jgi:hypothetical protein